MKVFIDCDVAVKLAKWGLLNRFVLHIQKQGQSNPPRRWPMLSSAMTRKSAARRRATAGSTCAWKHLADQRYLQNSQSPASPRRAGHHCGITVMRRLMRCWMHCLIGIKQRSQNRTIVPISASIGESKTSESDPLSGRVVPETHQDNPKWHTSEKNRPFRLPNRGSQCAKMGILRTGQDAILGVVRLDFLSSQALAIERQASAQSALVCLGRRVSKPKTRAILGLMRLNFLSVA